MDALAWLTSLNSAYALTSSLPLLDSSQVSYLQYPASCFPTSPPVLLHVLFPLPETSSLSHLIYSTQHQGSALMSPPPGSLPCFFPLPATGRIESSVLPSTIASHPFQNWWPYYKCPFISPSLSLDPNTLSAESQNLAYIKPSMNSWVNRINT